MFGKFYARRDDDLRAKKWSQEDYARELLAEILNRAQVLKPIHRRCREVDDQMDRAEALEQLAGAVELFLHDVDEASERGRRASLYAVTDFGLLDDACQGGGDLVPQEVAS